VVVSDFFESHSQLLLALLPFAAGVCAGMAEKKRWKAQVHDSVLRYCLRENDWGPEFMRTTFCSIVNDRKPLLHVDGSELPKWKANLHRILLFTTFTMLLLIVILMITPPVSEGTNVELAQWALLSPAAPTFFLVYYGVRLMGKTHRTKLQIRPANKGDRWKTITITGERDEDGMPTQNVNVDRP
jgi:hypothetical protein